MIGLGEIIHKSPADLLHENMIALRAMRNETIQVPNGTQNQSAIGAIAGYQEANKINIIDSIRVSTDCISEDLGNLFQSPRQLEKNIARISNIKSSISPERLNTNIMHFVDRYYNDVALSEVDSIRFLYDSEFNSFGRRISKDNIKVIIDEMMEALTELDVPSFVRIDIQNKIDKALKILSAIGEMGTLDLWQRLWDLDSNFVAMSEVSEKNKSKVDARRQKWKSYLYACVLLPSLGVYGFGSNTLSYLQFFGYSSIEQLIEAAKAHAPVLQIKGPENRLALPPPGKDHGDESSE